VIFFRPSKSPVLPACPASGFLTGARGCSAHSSCSAETLGAPAAQGRWECLSSALRRTAYKRCSTKASAPGYLVLASGDPTLRDASLC